ncbi:unnamed protein product [Pieris brassicae]|uniref:Major facilitator superfamily (MFS) profile domain-containing protein n=1 Tax=Pieris brassicae TaxID=7116 RepID=A0A9P0TQ64_PIEBR|nr:unnamed protein product [Pieris brassicae]
MKSFISHSSERNLKHNKEIAKNNESKDPLDNITFKVIGDFGKWQFKTALLMALLKLPMAWYQLNILFLAPPQNFWCEKPMILSQYSDGEWRDICAPFTQAVMMWGVVCGGILFPMWADRYGRKNPLMAGIVIQCVAGFVTSVVKQYWIFMMSWFILAVAVGGLGVVSFVMSIEGAVPALFLYSGELFPTLGRNAGVGGVTTFARIASMVAPGIVSLDEIFADLPLILLAFVSFCQLTLLLPLPETKGLPLPDTLEDAERYSTNQNIRHGGRRNKK